MAIFPGGIGYTNYTVQDVIDRTAQDMRQILTSAVGSNDSTILIDYCNRVCLQVLRASAWTFLLSPTQTFITQTGQTNYWIGPTSNQLAGTVDTGLNLSTVRRIKEDSVFDRTNFRKLYLTEEPPLAATLAYGDSTSRPGRPKLWRNAVDTPYVLNIYPAPDNQSRYLPVPEAPICDSLTAGGTLPARFYWIQLSFVDSFGNEGTVGPANKIFVPANQLVTVQPPIEPLISSTGVRYNRFNVYASATQGGECLQPSGPFQSAWTEPTSGLVTNTGQPPTTSLIEPIDGYLIEFKYYTFRTQLTDPNMQLQIPDDYIDVLVAGVNWLTNEYIKRPTDAKIWQDIYVQGIGMIRRDQNMYPHRDFIHSDTATINSNFPAVEVTDPSITRTN